MHGEKDPAKIGFKDGRVFLSVHSDVYMKIRSMLLHVLNMIQTRALTDQVNMTKVLQTVEEQTGMPVDITASGLSSPGDGWRQPS